MMNTVLKSIKDCFYFIFKIEKHSQFTKGVTTKPGCKAPGDLKIYLNGFPIYYKELVEVVLIMYQNEDRIYPPADGFKGGQMLLELITEVCRKGKTDAETWKKYKL